MADLIRGRAASQRVIPEAVLEFMIMQETHMSLDEVRALGPKDRRALDIMSQFTLTPSWRTKD